MERLQAGFAETVNPYNSGHVRRVSLLPEDVEAFVFWTRDPRHILPALEELEERRFYVMTTLTGYPAGLEPGAPPEKEVIAAMRDLAEKIGPQRVIWRYDPLFLSSLTDEAFHFHTFKRLALALGSSVGRVIISLYDDYAGARRRITRLEQEGAFRVFPLTGEKDNLTPRGRELLAGLAAAAAEAGIPLYSCAEGEELEELGIRRGACIDGNLLAELWGIPPGAKDRNQRPRCLCVSSVDIGRYGTCPAGCLYCYARR